MPTKQKNRMKITQLLLEILSFYDLNKMYIFFEALLPDIISVL